MASPGELVRAAREARGWSQRELGAQIGVTAVAISRIESGQRFGALDTWRRLVALLDIPAGAVLAPLPEDKDTDVELTPCAP